MFRMLKIAHRISQRKPCLGYSETAHSCMFSSVGAFGWASSSFSLDPGLEGLKPVTEFSRPPSPNLDARDGVTGGTSLAISGGTAWFAVVSVSAVFSIPVVRRCLAPSCPAAAAAEAAVASAAVLNANKSLNAVAFALASLAAACCALIPAVISSGMIRSARLGAADSPTSG